MMLMIYSWYSYVNDYYLEMKKWIIGGDVFIIFRNNNLSMKMSFRRSDIDQYKNYVGGRKLK